MGKQSANIDRKRLLAWSCTAPLCFALLLAGPSRAQPSLPPFKNAAVADGPPVSAQLSNWIAGHARPVRSIDATDEDFSDLEPLTKAIGSTDIVALGEPGHGAGSSFAAKVRLIKFLHQRMGFDVLVWESGNV